ncbi:LUD domain-containing protein [Hyunsoonleella sp. SJ7]|uniref:LUD domain-containing protein n=1 Tax=Hyunsoonleella aquatilis TaxID=2762758 RepID=A0A923KIK8_9FLAO|nr:LUD domain-containing protein [Hyunsoonleella aquatilis]MBC3758739.1 LUD domain-containing protein [Hyunsoonleella aquatilis]
MGREAILKSVKANRPEVLPLPEIDVSAFKEDINLIERFKNNITLVGGNIIEANKGAIDSPIKESYPDKTRIVSTTDKSSLGTVTVDKNMDPHNLETVDLAIIEAELGVAENGAVWVSAKDSIVRVLPFITNDLVIILKKDSICLHMLEAYDKIAKRDRDFGVFISGPSKTADIEQCLVVGAHGAMSLTVLLV